MFYHQSAAATRHSYQPCVPLAIKAIMISFKVSQLDLIALKRNNVKISNNTIMIVLIAKGTQGRFPSHSSGRPGLVLRTATKLSSVGFEPTAVLTFGLRVRRLATRSPRDEVRVRSGLMT